MCFTDVYKHTKSTKEDIMIEITWIFSSVSPCAHSSCTVWHSYLRADFSTPEPSLHLKQKFTAFQYLLNFFISRNNLVLIVTKIIQK